MFNIYVRNNSAIKDYLSRNPDGVLSRYFNANPTSPLGTVMGNAPPQYSRGVPNTPNMGLGVTSFAEGGMVTPNGGAIRPGAPMAAAEAPQLGASAPPSVDTTQIEQEAQRVLRANPELVKQVQGILAVAMESGELSMDELSMAIQLAKVALGNPAAYPQLRQFAIANGLGSEADIPQEMDKGFLFGLVVAGKALQANPDTGSTNNNMQGPKHTSAVPEYRDGGMTGDKTHLAKLHPREYVIPEDALLYHGKKHFDKLVEQARTPPNESQ